VPKLCPKINNNEEVKKIYIQKVKQLKHIPLFLLLILILTSCSKHVVEKKIILDKPIPLPIEEPMPIEKIIPGIIPETIIKKAEKKYGIFARNRYKAFNAKLRKLQNSSTEVKLEEINNFFNNVPYSADIKIWGKSDYWATPLEFLGKDKGDCEDYVIAKYFSLRNLGVQSKKLYFSYVKAILFKKTHMVLSYYETPFSIPLILDSLNFKVLPADKRKDLIPIYNFNGESYCVKQKSHKKWDKLVIDIKRNKL
jgi:predicted transglutaminase-like cysteine proteinase